MSDKPSRRELVSASVGAELLDRIKGALAPDETQATFIREAVERELQWREGGRAGV